MSTYPYKPTSLKQAIRLGYKISNITRNENAGEDDYYRVEVSEIYGSRKTSFWITPKYLKRNYPEESVKFGIL